MLEATNRYITLSWHTITYFALMIDGSVRHNLVIEDGKLQTALINGAHRILKGNRVKRHDDTREHETSAAAQCSHARPQSP